MPVNPLPKVSSAARFLRDAAVASPPLLGGLASGLHGGLMRDRGTFMEGFAQGFQRVPGAMPAARALEADVGRMEQAGLHPEAIMALDWLAPDMIPGPNLGAIKFLHATPHRFKRPEISSRTFRTGEGTALETSHGRGLYGSHPESEGTHDYYMRAFSAPSSPSAKSREGYLPEIDVDELLVEDIPLRDQPQRVRERLAPLMEDLERGSRYWGVDDVEDLEGATIRTILGEEALFEAGIPGQRYPDWAAKNFNPDVTYRDIDYDALGPLSGAERQKLDLMLEGVNEREGMGYENVDILDDFDNEIDTLEYELDYAREARPEAVKSFEEELAVTKSMRERVANASQIRKGQRDPTYNTVWFPGSEQYMEWRHGPLSGKAGKTISGPLKSWEREGPLAGKAR